MRNGLVAGCVCVVTFVVAVSGCSPKDAKIRVDISSAFKGHAKIGCQGMGQQDAIVSLDSSGFGTVAACPKAASDVVVVRDSATVPADILVIKTGDGITTGFEFDIK